MHPLRLGDSSWSGAATPPARASAPCARAASSRRRRHAVRASRSLPPGPQGRGAGSLVDKWNAVRAEAAEEEAIEEEEARPRSFEELEAEKRRRLSEWKDGLSTDHTQRNTNFAPVVGDWRARVAEARARKGGSARAD